MRCHFHNAILIQETCQWLDPFLDLSYKHEEEICLRYYCVMTLNGHLLA